MEAELKVAMTLAGTTIVLTGVDSVVTLGDVL